MNLVFFLIGMNLFPKALGRFEKWKWMKSFESELMTDAETDTNDRCVKNM